MSKFLETYGVAIFTLVLVAILIAFAGPLGIKIKEYTLEKAKQIEQIGNKEIENRNSKNYEAVDIEKSWTETHTDSYFFERVSSDKTNTDYNKWKSNNKGKNSTSAVSTFTIDAPKDMEYSFNWTVSSENRYDKLSTTIVNAVSGMDNGTEKITLKSGTNTLKAIYSKDSSSSRYDDCATITLPKILIKNAGCKNKQTGEVLDHSYDKGKITKEATYIEYGEKLFTCENCGNTKTEVIEKLDMPAVDQIYCIYYDDGELTISKNEIEPEAGRTVVNKGFYSKPMNCTKEMTTVRFIEAVKPKSCYQWFGSWSGSCYKLKEIKNIENLCTDKCTNMSYMFTGCTQLNSLDVSHFDTSKVLSMQSMFDDCEKLINLDVSNFDTSNVADMSSMFDDCKNLISLDVSHFDTSNVTSMQSMFNTCEKLNSLDVSHFDTSKVTNIGGMFCFCKNLTNLDVSNFDTSQVNDMQWVFNNCQSLTTITFGDKFTTSKVLGMNDMFSHCEKLTNLDVSRFDTSQVCDLHNMFDNCKSLKTLDLSHWNTNNVYQPIDMFYNCISLSTKSIKVSQATYDKLIAEPNLGITADKFDIIN